MIYDTNNGLFLSVKNMEDMATGKKSKVVAKIKDHVPFNIYKGIMNDFHKSVIYEIMPALQLDINWLREITGVNGDYYANVSSHGVDAMIYDPATKEKATLELKMFNTLTSEYKTRYFDGTNYWTVDKKTWKFRPSNGSMLSSDFALCMMSDAESDDLVDAILVPHSIMTTYLPMCSDKKDIQYSKLKNHSHMNGNKSTQVKLEQFIKRLRNDGIIYQKSKSGVFYTKYSHTGYSIAETFAEVKNWFERCYPEVITQYHPG